MQPIPIGQVLLRFDRSAAAAAPDQVAAIALDDAGDLWLGAVRWDAILRLTPEAAGGASKRTTWASQAAVEVAAMLDLPDPGDPLDLTGMACTADHLWFIGSHAGTRRLPDPELSDAENLERLRYVEPIHRRALIGRARLKAGRLPEPADLAVLPIGEGGNDLTRVLATDPHLGTRFTPGPVPMAENGLGLAGLACRAGRLWIGLSAPVMGGYAVVLELEPYEERPGVIGLESIGLDGRPYRKHLIDLNGRGVHALRWHNDALLILAGPGPCPSVTAGPPGVYRLREAARLSTDSLIGADDARLTLMLPLAAPASPTECTRAIEVYDGLGKPGLMVVSGKPQARSWGSLEGVSADVYALPLD
jgi:hypothetical protein